MQNLSANTARNSESGQADQLLSPAAVTASSPVWWLKPLRRWASANAPLPLWASAAAGFSHHYMDVDAIEATHGVPFVRVGYKLCRPTTSCSPTCGDGDFALSALAI